jgi:hypothetical protein
MPGRRTEAGPSSHAFLPEFGIIGTQLPVVIGLPPIKIDGEVREK